MQLHLGPEVIPRGWSSRLVGAVQTLTATRRLFGQCPVHVQAEPLAKTSDAGSVGAVYPDCTPVG